jgi:hypothetical protein
MRLEVRESREEITAARAAEAWPPRGVEWTELHLAAVGPASPRPSNRARPDQFPAPIPGRKPGLVVASKTAYLTRSSFIHLR